MFLWVGCCGLLSLLQATLFILLSHSLSSLLPLRVFPRPRSLLLIGQILVQDADRLREILSFDLAGKVISKLLDVPKHRTQALAALELILRNKRGVQVTYAFMHACVRASCACAHANLCMSDHRELLCSNAGNCVLFFRRLDLILTRNACLFFAFRTPDWSCAFSPSSCLSIFPRQKP